MIVEQRDYHVFTGKLNEVVRLYETEGIELQQRHLGNLIGVVHDGHRRALDLHLDVGLRELCRTRGAPREPAGRRGAGATSWAGSSRFCTPSRIAS